MGDTVLPDRQAAIELWVEYFSVVGPPHRCGAVPIAINRKISMAVVELPRFLLNLLKPGFAGWDSPGSGSWRWVCAYLPGCWMQLYYSGSMLEVGKLSMDVDVVMHLSLLRESKGLSTNVWGVYLVHTLNCLMNYLSLVLCALAADSKHIEQIPNELITQHLNCHI